MSNIFAQATKKKLRFQSQRGQLSTEDLWDLKLQELNEIGMELRATLRQSEDSLIDEPKTGDQGVVQLKFDVVKFIIDAKIAERDARRQREANRQELDRLQKLLDQKNDQALQELTPDEIRARIKSLEE